MKKIMTLLLMMSALITSAQKGQGAIKGVVIDDSGEPIPFASVMLLKSNNQLIGTTTDFDGYFVLRPIPEGIYDVKFSFVGYQTKRVREIPVKLDTLSIVGVTINFGDEDETQELTYSDFSLIENQYSTNTTLFNQKTQEYRAYSPANIEKTTSNETITVRCGSPGASVVFIDGVKVIHSCNKPLVDRIKEVQVKPRGVPAQYENKEKRQGFNTDFIYR